MSDHQCQCGHPLSHHAHGHRCLRNVSAYRACPCEHFEIDQAEAVPVCPNCGHVHGGRAPSGRCYHLDERDEDGQRASCRCRSTVPLGDEDEDDRRHALAPVRRAAVLHPMMRPRPEYPEPHFDWPELGEIAAILGIDIVKAGDHQ